MAYFCTQPESHLADHFLRNGRHSVQTSIRVTDGLKGIPKTLGTVFTAANTLQTYSAT
jgi:hypothetical protein